MHSLRWFAVMGVTAGALHLAAQPPMTTPATGAGASTVVVTPASPATNTVAVPATPAVPAGTLPPSTITPGDPNAGRLINLSTRARVTADTPLITGFALSGTGSRTILLRAVGPSLAIFGVANALAAPRLQLFDADNHLLRENSGWASGPENVAELGAAMARAGAFPLAADAGKDAAILAVLPPGVYTLHVTGTDGGSGVTLAEIYDVDGMAPGPRLANVSTRTIVAPAGGELISGFVVGGTAPRQFLMRGVGPGLENFRVSGTLGNPKLAVYDSTGRQVAANDNWSGTQVTVIATGSAGNGQITSMVTTIGPSAAEAANDAEVTAATNAVGAFPLPRFGPDAALVTTLAPGAYTVQVSGADRVAVGTVADPIAVASGASGSTGTGTRTPADPGVALLELYEVP